MANLLPQKELSILAFERRRRLRIAALALLCGVSAFGTVLLIPSAVVLFAAKKSGEERLATTRRLVELQKTASAGADIAATKEKMELVAHNEASIAPHELMTRLSPLLPGGVALHTVSFRREGAGVVLDLSGRAADRTALLAFGDALESSGLFVTVNIPIESLAGSADLQFRLILTLVEDTP